MTGLVLDAIGPNALDARAALAQLTVRGELRSENSGALMSSSRRSAPMRCAACGLSIAP